MLLYRSLIEPPDCKGDGTSAVEMGVLDGPAIPKYDSRSLEKPCAYASGKFSPPKSTIDAEIFAVMNSLESLKIYYLEQEEILIRTDCQAITSVGFMEGWGGICKSRRMRSIGVFRRDLTVRVFRAAALGSVRAAASGFVPSPRDLHHCPLSFLLAATVCSWQPFSPVIMTDSSSSSTVHTNVPDVGSTRMDNVPVQGTTIQLNKENYLRWSAAITVGIAGRGRIAYVNGRKVEPVEGSIAWDTWYLEENQVKMWIINSVSSEIQPLILRKKTARDMWVILEHMYGQKKRKVRVYQLMRDVYSLRQGSRSVVEFYAALKSKWEDLDYHSDLTWKSQILNSDESFSIEDVYTHVEAEEQRKLVSNDRRREEQSAFLSRASVGSSCFSRNCTHCKKLGHTIDFCWDLHPEKKNSKGRTSASKQSDSSVTGPSDRKGSFSAEQLRELRAYLSQVYGDARREARKAFLAFSCSQGNNFTRTESSKSDSTCEVDNLVDSDRLVSESTPADFRSSGGTNFRFQLSHGCRCGGMGSDTAILKVVDTRVFLLHNKQDLHGLGYDPFRHAPDFKAGRLASGIGIGVLEDLDIEDEDIYASGLAVSARAELTSGVSSNWARRLPPDRLISLLSGEVSLGKESREQQAAAWRTAKDGRKPKE
ncbi:Polyprotein P3 [Nymphaea thermarum]|nr:Polyprotein P3 [Nymphaea thermarum]